LLDIDDGRCAEIAMNIETGWKNGGKPAPEFIIFQVEQLLDQAADLLDRGLRDRAEWDRKAVDAVNLGVELDQFHRLDEIHLREDAAGYYTWAASVARSDAAAEKTLYESAEAAAKQIEDYGNKYLDGDGLRRREVAAQKEAALSPLPYYKEDAEGKHPIQYHPNASPLPAVSGEKSDLFETFAIWESTARLNLERCLLRSQYSALSSAAEAGKQRSKGATDKQNWEESNILFQQERTSVVREIMYLKQLLATCPDGVLNYIQRMKAIQSRFHRDFRDAIARIKAAQQGLQKLYGYTEPLPDENSPSYFDLVLGWTRDAIRKRVRFSHYDQNLVFPLSVRSSCGGDEKWSEGKRTGHWKCRFSEDMVPTGIRHVRLRGISAFVVSDEKSPNGLWQVTARAPRRSMCRRLDDRVEPLDQTKIPPCWLFRTTVRQDRREPDVVGSVALHNVSPFSTADPGPDDDWEIAIAQTSSSGVSRNAIEDVFIDLFLAAQIKR
jgi:hypothetical protein